MPVRVYGLAHSFGHGDKPPGIIDGVKRKYYRFGQLQCLVPVLAFPAATFAQLPESQSPSWWLFMLPALVALIVILGLVGILVYFRRRPPSSKAALSSLSLSANLVNLETKQTHAVDALPWRIGRSRINSLPVDDHSVSRVHAEINADDAGKFHVADLESLNGVYVNEQKIDIAPINNGDIIDVGDIRFRFETAAVTPRNE